KPVLVEGPAGVGKTELAKAVASTLGARLIRLQCYEGLDESKAIYEWNYKKQLLRIQADREHERDWETVESDIFSEAFLLTRPLLEAIRADEPVVLLIDEVDRVEIETEALLLEVLSDFQVSIPELGTIEGNKQRPMVFLTSNNTRELSEALKRRCLFLHIDYPDVEREKEIVRVRVPEVDEALAEQIAKVVGSIRHIDLKKAPSISETIDWARTLIYLGRNEITPEVMGETLHVLLKYQTDITKARKELGVDQPATPAARRKRGRCMQWQKLDYALQAQRGERISTALQHEPAMLDVLQGFVHELRAAGLPVSMTENLDAMRAVEYIDIGEREVLRAVLGATLVKHQRHRAAFDTVFDVHFSLFSPGADAPSELDLPEELFGGITGDMQGGGAGGDLSREELAEMLLRALQNMNLDELRRLAGMAVTQFAGMEPGRPVGGTYYLYRTLRQLDLEDLSARLLGQARERGEVPDDPLG